MAPRRGRRRRRRTMRTRPSVSVVTYQRFVDMQVTSRSGNTVLASAPVADVNNLSGETVNRKILRVSGTLAASSTLAGNTGIAAMFALLAHPKLEDIPSVADFDPFDDGPDGSNTYEGRPSPRPFGRKYFAFANVSGAPQATYQEEFRYRTKAQRLLRPGWELHSLLYVRVNSGTPTFRLNGVISASVAG